jgi:two-component system, OmpR family, response regulator
MKILVVEDEVKLARSLEKGLSAEGYIVDVVHDSSGAQSLVSGGSYDLVLLDWMIPGPQDGPALIKVWREAHEQAPILLLTARSTIGDRVHGLDVGADDYLTKPFSFDELLARVRALLRRPKEHHGSVLQSGQLKLDITAHTATCAGKSIPLTAKEFQLVEYLMRHKGEVIGKDRLLDHVWSDDARVQHNTVETFIANVRKKLGKYEDIIITVRGYGYKVE